jgi:hypothetical protein
LLARTTASARARQGENCSDNGGAVLVVVTQEEDEDGREEEGEEDDEAKGREGKDEMLINDPDHLALLPISYFPSCSSTATSSI